MDNLNGAMGIGFSTDKGIVESVKSRVLSLVPKVTHPGFYLFIMNLFLISPLFFPSLIDLGPWDEMIHVNSGRLLVNGKLPNIPGHPLIALLYAIAYLPTQGASSWFLQNVMIGRLIMFCMMWWSAYLIAKQLSNFSPPLIMAGFLLISPAATELFLNPPDALFAAMSGFSLWQFLRFYNTRNVRHLVFTSILLGVSTLARLDSLVIFPVFTVLAILIAFPQNKSLKWFLRLLGACVIPFVIVLFSYQLIYGVIAGDFNLGIARYTYFSFKSGHQVVATGEAGISTIEAREQADLVYGTGIENRFSFINAILNNTSAYIERLKAIIPNLPADMLDAYGKRLAAPIFVLAARGLLLLVRKKAFGLLAILALWPTHLVSYTIVGLPDQAHYLRMAFFIVLALASLGLHITLSEHKSWRERILISVFLIALAIYGIVDNKLAIYAGTSVFLIGLWMIWSMINHKLNVAHKQGVALLLALCLGLIIRGPYPSPGIQKFGDDPTEQAVLFMMENFEVDSNVVSYEPGMVLAARMKHLRFPSDLRSLESSEELYQWMIDNNVKAIYATSGLRKFEPYLWSMVDELSGKGLEIAFDKDPGSIQIILVHPPQADG